MVHVDNEDHAVLDRADILVHAAHVDILVPLVLSDMDHEESEDHAVDMMEDMEADTMVGNLVDTEADTMVDSSEDMVLDKC